jgi:glycosyltransferase involved in cell wall biosynthesis
MFNLNNISFQQVLDENPFDLFYSGLPTAYKNINIKFGNCENLGTIHGFRELECSFDDCQLFYRNTGKEVLKYLLNKYIPSFFFKRNLIKYSSLFNIQNSKYVFVSEHTKASAQVFFSKFDLKDTPVLYSPSTSLDVEDKFLEPYYEDKYWLLISGGRWLKNSYRAAMAFDQLFSEMPNIKGKVVIIGIKNSKYFCKYLNNQSRFEFIDYVNNIDLKRMFKGAYGFVYPTLNEGFGYPPLEAMKFGIPVLSSSFSSIPEICNDAVIYFNPLSISEIKNRIIQLEDPVLYQKYSNKGILRYNEVLLRQNSDLNKLIKHIID